MRVSADSAAGTCHGVLGEVAPADRQPVGAVHMSMHRWHGGHRDTCDVCCMVKFVAMASAIHCQAAKAAPQLQAPTPELAQVR